MKVLACIVLALAVCAFAEEEKKDKRTIFNVGYGAYPYSYGYPYASYPYAYSGSQLAYTVPAKTEVIPGKAIAYTTTVPKVSSIWPYTTSGILPYSGAGVWPYNTGAYPYVSSPYGYNYGYNNYGYNYGLGLAGKYIH